MMVKLSVVIPIYNSANFIAKTLTAVDNYLKSSGISCELVIVDDGSTDNSQTVVSSWIGQRTYSVLLKNDKNMGKGFAIRRGVDHAGGEYILITDGDLSFPMDNLPAALKQLELGADIIVGNRRLAKSIYHVTPDCFRGLFSRHLISGFFNALVRLILNTRTQDIQCGFKCFRTKTSKKLFNLSRENGFVLDSEIIFLAQRYGLVIREMPVIYEFRKSSSVHLLKDSLRMFWGLLRIKARYIKGVYKIN